MFLALSVPQARLPVCRSNNHLSHRSGNRPRSHRRPLQSARSLERYSPTSPCLLSCLQFPLRSNQRRRRPKNCASETGFLLCSHQALLFSHHPLRRRLRLPQQHHPQHRRPIQAALALSPMEGIYSFHPPPTRDSCSFRPSLAFSQLSSHLPPFQRAPLAPQSSSRNMYKVNDPSCTYGFSKDGSRRVSGTSKSLIAPSAPSSTPPRILRRTDIRPRS